MDYIVYCIYYKYNTIWIIWIKNRLIIEAILFTSEYCFLGLRYTEFFFVTYYNISNMYELLAIY